VSGGDRGFTIRGAGGDTCRASRIVTAGGVWLGQMLAWLGVSIAVKCLVRQLIVTERMRR
jgi:hypothetical protein